MKIFQSYISIALYFVLQSQNNEPFWKELRPSCIQVDTHTPYGLVSPGHKSSYYIIIIHRLISLGLYEYILYFVADDTTNSPFTLGSDTK